MGSRVHTVRQLTILALCWALSVPPAGAQTGTIAPFPLHQFLDNSGAVCNGCQLDTYVAGTTTNLPTYTDSALSVAHPNPIVLNASGRPSSPIYLSASNYKFRLRTSVAAGGAILWTVDNISAVPATTIAASLNGECNGRLTLTTVTPVTAADVLAATTIYFSPYLGNRCALYDGAQWNITSFTERSLALGADPANTNYDLFLFLSGGTPTIERVAWSGAETRATALTLQDGVLVKSGDATRRYVGTYRTTAVAGQTEDSVLRRFVWNYRHRVRRPLRVLESADSWAYTTAILRQVNGNAANKAEVVIGVAEVLVTLRAVAMATNTINTVVVTSIAEGSNCSTTTAASGVLMQNAYAQAVGTAYATTAALLERQPALGFKCYVWLEYSGATGITTWYGDNGAPTNVQTGMTGSIEG